MHFMILALTLLILCILNEIDVLML